jgi:DNA-binding NarL/FixJ family response regulator
MKIVIVDDHVMYREGLKRVLAPALDFEVVGEAGTARAAFPVVDAKRPDVVILDLLLPGMDGCSAARELGRRLPQARLLVVTVCDGLDDMFDAFSAGVTGYMLKSEPVSALIEALRSVHRGERYLSPALASRSQEMAAGGAPHPVLGTLSVREREVFHLAIEGLANTEIARELCISRKTVETHKYRLQKKLGLHNANELLRFAALHGLIRRTRRDVDNHANVNVNGNGNGNGQMSGGNGASTNGSGEAII